MITQTPRPTIAAVETTLPRWKRDLRDAVTDADELLAILGLSASPLAARIRRENPFPLRVPLPFVARMRPGDPDDPLLGQVLPVAKEYQRHPGFVDDPLQEAAHNPVPGIVHKYRGRVLLITTPVCAVNCRYCFRRHFPYQENTPGKRQWLASLEYIARDPSISEVILSGGDPLASDDRHLRWLVERIEAISHVKRLRIHTRLPVVIPARIDRDCLAWLAAGRLGRCVVLHINHGNEIDDALADAVARLRGAGITVLNQTVLLRGVNDDATTLIHLSEKMFDAGILPYYLHLLDRVAGAGHFFIPDRQAIAIYDRMRRELPGYLLPKLARDVPGEAAKTIIGARPRRRGADNMDN